ncbi:MAG: hypothetical protein WCQ60_00890 [bacterium]
MGVKKLSREAKRRAELEAHRTQKTQRMCHPSETSNYAMKKKRVSEGGPIKFGWEKTTEGQEHSVHTTYHFSHTDPPPLVSEPSVSASHDFVQMKIPGTEKKVWGKIVNGRMVVL